MNKPQFKISISDDVAQRLATIGDRYGMTPNAIVAAAAYEISRIRPESLWHALGRIATDEGVTIMPPADALPAPRKQPKRAIPA